MSKGKSLTFVSLFDEVERVEIPIIQRDYAQGRVEASDVRQQFLEAILGILNTPKDQLFQPLDLDFVYGSFEDKSGRVFSVLDGQQRLTTLFLLHWYLALIDGKRDDFLSRFTDDGRSRFTYKTRPSSSEFFDAIVAHDFLVPAKDKSVSSAMLDCQWFFLSWKQDPTIQSCLTMLDAIHQFFYNSEGLYSCLIDSGAPYILFQYLNLEEFGLSDDLYIKMNARGRPLSNFENFKAWLFGYITDFSDASKFEHSVDQEWTDIFWQLGQINGTDFDSLFLRFFYKMALFVACEKFDGRFFNTSKEERLWLGKLRTTAEYLPVRKFEEARSFTEADLVRIAKYLEFYRLDEDAVRRNLLEEVLESNDYVVLSKFYSLIKFLSIAPNISDWDTDTYKKLRNWIRITNNLVCNARIDEFPTFIPAIKSLNKLGDNCLDIYEYVAEITVDEISFFPSSQCSEEIEKAKLILGDEQWEPILEQYENHEYLQGKVGFILKFATNDAEIVSPDDFCACANKVSVLLSGDILRSNEFLLQRALLVFDDYLVPRGGYKASFCAPSNRSYRDRSENWLSVVEADAFKSLLNNIDGEVIESLRRIIADVDCGGWRQLMVENPEIIGYCTENLIHRANNEIYLLTKSRLSGYHAELRTFVLELELKNLAKTGTLPDFFETVNYMQVYGDGLPGISIKCNGLSPFVICYQKYYFAFDSNSFQKTDLPEYLVSFFSSLRPAVELQ